jgi:hypothetical protein
MLGFFLTLWRKFKHTNILGLGFGKLQVTNFNLYQRNYNSDLLEPTFLHFPACHYLHRNIYEIITNSVMFNTKKIL